MGAAGRGQGLKGQVVFSVPIRSCTLSSKTMLSICIFNIPSPAKQGMNKESVFSKLALYIFSKEFHHYPTQARLKKSPTPSKVAICRVADGRTTISSKSIKRYQMQKEKNALITTWRILCAARKKTFAKEEHCIQGLA